MSRLVVMCVCIIAPTVYIVWNMTTRLCWIILHVFFVTIDRWCWKLLRLRNTSDIFTIWTCPICSEIEATVLQLGMWASGMWRQVFCYQSFGETCYLPLHSDFTNLEDKGMCLEMICNDASLLCCLRVPRCWGNVTDYEVGYHIISHAVPHHAVFTHTWKSGR
jgi:hypothetical protein